MIVQLCAMCHTQHNLALGSTQSGWQVAPALLGVVVHDQFQPTTQCVPASQRRMLTSHPCCHLSVVHA